MSLDYASILSQAQNLTPDYQDQRLRGQEADARMQDIALRSQAMQQKMAEAQKEAQEKAAAEADLHEVLLRPTPEKITAFHFKHPAYAAEAKAGFDMLEADHKTHELTQMGSIFYRAQAGDHAGAAKILRTRIEADKAAGQDTAEDEALLAGLESDNPMERNLATGHIGILTAAVDPENFAKLFPADKSSPSPFAKEYNDRLQMFGKAAADLWAERNDTKMIPVQAGGKVFSYGGGTTGNGPSLSQPKGGDPASGGATYGYKQVAPTNRQDWDKRADGSAKGTGFLGLLQRPGGGVSSEISVGVGIGGKEQEIPLMVPGLTKPELDYLMTNDPEAPDFLKGLPPSIMDKAVAHAQGRLSAGLSPFAQSGEGFRSTQPEGWTPDLSPQAVIQAVKTGDWSGILGDPLRGKGGMPIAGGKYGAARDYGTHHAVDFTGAEGTPVYPASGTGIARVSRSKKGGNIVTVNHGGGLVTRYMHLGRVQVQDGQQVGPDTPLGTLGKSGRASGPNLHFEVRVNGKPIDPTSFGGIRQVRSIQEAKALKPGTIYRTPDGKTFRR